MTSATASRGSIRTVAETEADTQRPNGVLQIQILKAFAKCA